MIFESKVYEISLREDCDNGRDFVVGYFLLEETGELTKHIPFYKYGIKLEKRFPGESVCECSYRPNIAATRDGVSDLIRVLYQNKVTPIALDDVLADI